MSNNDNDETKPNIVVIMGATGSGKSRLAIDLSTHFPIEIISADSMQVYQGLDVLTNKVPVHEQKGVPHHLLGTISPDVEFTVKDFRDKAIPLIDDILSRDHLPVIVGGTNYYIQSLVSPFLLDELMEDMDENCSRELPGDKLPDLDTEFQREFSSYSHDRLQELDPVAANRIHPNDHRKINQYLSLYTRSGVLPSKLLRGKAMENWGRVDHVRYNCCFLCVDASIPVLDEYVERRVDCMVATGLLNEVYDIYNLNMDYTRGLRQAIGVREFEEFLRVYLSEGRNNNDTESMQKMSRKKLNNILKEDLSAILQSHMDNPLKTLLADSIENVKANTRRLVRRQKRRLHRLQALFGWDIHVVDATDSLLCFSESSWFMNVIDPSAKIISSYLNKDKSLLPYSAVSNSTERSKVIQRDLWMQHICKACGNRVLRGDHEWEQHIQGRNHRKRICSLRKLGILCSDQ
ncbi:tRNA dimethylallyltransferase 2 [Apium graveolens]|uniref:tRNA dimethylallyltransferase 2 n=1 Tax=Apium graveolens TaxID=4045 RepID=UPI003D79A46C